MLTGYRTAKFTCVPIDTKHSAVVRMLNFFTSPHDPDAVTFRVVLHDNTLNTLQRVGEAITEHIAEIARNNLNLPHHGDLSSTFSYSIMSVYVQGDKRRYQVKLTLMRLRKPSSIQLDTEDGFITYHDPAQCSTTLFDGESTATDHA